MNVRSIIENHLEVLRDLCEIEGARENGYFSLYVFVEFDICSCVLKEHADVQLAYSRFVAAKEGKGLFESGENPEPYLMFLNSASVPECASSLLGRFGVPQEIRDAFGQRSEFDSKIVTALQRTDVSDLISGHVGAEDFAYSRIVHEEEARFEQVVSQRASDRLYVLHVLEWACAKRYDVLIESCERFLAERA